MKYNHSMQKLWRLLFLGLAGVAIVLLAAGLSDLELLPGQTFPMGVLAGQQSIAGSSGVRLPTFLFPFSGYWPAVIVLFFMVIFCAWIITFILRPQARKRMLARLISYIIIFLTLYLFFNLLWSLDLTPFAKPEGDSGPPEFAAELAGQAAETPAPPSFVVDPPQWLVGLIVLLIVTALFGLIWLLWRRRRPAGEAPPLDLFVREAQQAVDELRTGHDLKDTVKRCYRDMHRILSEQRGLERPIAMTPREFEAHLTALGLRDEHIHRLTRLFENVRYSPQTPGQREEREALACLSAIVETYGRPS
jgi:hypothetical protein